jgi:hypothetical protein
MTSIGSFKMGSAVTIHTSVRTRFSVPIYGDHNPAIAAHLEPYLCNHPHAEGSNPPNNDDT